jgi:AcrR family transcriptional regulator
MSENTAPAVGENGSDARMRLVEAMTSVVAEKGYIATTITDVVARARVSRRTFYEHFSDKEDCLLACHAVLGSRMLDAVAAAASEDDDLADAPQLFAEAVSGLLRTLCQNPDLTQTHFVEMQAAGLRARQARREVQSRFAGLLQGLAARARVADPRIKVPSALMTTALVGGIGELIEQSVERGQVDRLEELAPVIVELCSAVLLTKDSFNADHAAARRAQG